MFAPFCIRDGPIMFNPLSTDDAICHRLRLACYQLAQSILKKDFALAKRAEIGGGAWFQHGRKALTKNSTRSVSTK